SDDIRTTGVRYPIGRTPLPPAQSTISKKSTIIRTRRTASTGIFLTGIFRLDRDSLIFCPCLFSAGRAGLLARFLLTGLGWWGACKRGVPLPCVTSAYTTSSHALQRSVTSLRPTTSTPVHVGLLRLRIPQRRSAF